MSSLPTRVTLFGKHGCHLCDEVGALLTEVATELDFDLQTIDITTDDELFAAYRYEIPVVHVGAREIGRGRLSEVQWLDRLRSALRG